MTEDRFERWRKRSDAGVRKYEAEIMDEIGQKLEDMPRTGLTRGEVYWWAMGMIRGLARAGAFSMTSTRPLQDRIIQKIFGRHRDRNG